MGSWPPLYLRIDFRFVFAYAVFPALRRAIRMVTSSIPVLAPVSTAAWELPDHGLSVFYGRPETPRLFHYFLPRAILQGKQVICLDGGNRFDPLLIARFARQRNLDSSEFGQHIRIARAFTCFQLTELLVRLPRLLRTFRAQRVIVTAFPDLYFDEDIREREALTSFQRGLLALKVAAVPVAIFSDATSSKSSRRVMFQNLIGQADHVLRFSVNESTSLALTSEKFDPTISRALL